MIMDRYSKQLAFPLRDFPLKNAGLELELTFAADVPRAAQGRWIAEALRRLADEAENGEAVVVTAPKATPQVVHEEAAAWQPPADMDMRRVKSAHRFLVAAAELGQRGPAPTLAEIAKRAHLSMPPVYALADPETPGGAYIAPLVRIEKKGHTKVVDVTPLGRKVASRVRAGTLQRLADPVETHEAKVAAKPAPAQDAAWQPPAGQDEVAWDPPYMDMRRVKSAHRFLAAAAELSRRGPVTLAEIGKKSRLSAPTLHRLVDSSDESGAYLAPLLRVGKRGRAKTVEVNALGQQVAAEVRAGALPT